ncbi:TonB-dependent receptor [Rhizobium sp. CRIBSB]|nr:TonB-dependent receptor [Rhizobium sp. CRIBSB]
MIRTVLLAGSACVAMAGTAHAQSVPVTDAPAPARQGVLVFQPDFFREARPDTALDMIARLPGFSLNTGDNDSRGFAGAAGNVLIDGARPSSKSDSLDQVLRRISADSVDRIELIRGGAPGIDMQGQAVVANVILRRSVTIERVIEANAYTYPDGYVGPVITASYSRREGDDQIEGSITATTDRTDGTGDGYRRRYDGSGSLIQDADVILWDRFRNVQATGAVQRMAGGGRLRVNGLIGWNDHDYEQDVILLSGPGADEASLDTEREIKGELGLNWTRPLTPRLELELTALQRLESEDGVSTFASGGDTATFGADVIEGESIARGVLRFRQNDRWAWEAGGEAAYNLLDSETSYAENGIPVPLPGAGVKVEELRGEVFGQTTWRPGSHWTVEAGLRVEVSEISQSGDSETAKSFVYPKPRLQITWTPAQGHQFRFRAEREVGQLDFGDFVASAEVDLGQVQAGNPDLEPYKSNTWQLVYERRFWDQAVIAVTYSHVDIEDFIDVIPLTGGFEAVGNIGDGSQDVLDLNLTLPLDRLGLANARLQARASFRDSSVTDPLTGEDRRFSGQGAFGCGVSFNHDLDGGRWSYGFDHGCNLDRGVNYRIRETRTFEGEPFVTLYGQWRPSTDLTLRLDLGNATDREQRRLREIHSGPRHTSPVVRREAFATRMSPWLFVQIRKTF